MRIKLRFLSLVTLIFLTTGAFGQMVKAKWSYGFVQKEAKVGDIVDLFIEGTPPSGWHIYSTRNECDGAAPTLTQLTLEKNATYELVGGLIPNGDHKKLDEDFECNVYLFNNNQVAKFKQKVKILSPNPIIKGYLEGQMCATACVQFDLPDWTFSGLKIKGTSSSAVKEIIKDELQPGDEKTSTEEPGIDVNEVGKIDTASSIDSAQETKDVVAALKNTTPSYRSDVGGEGNCEPKVFDGAGSSKKEKESYWGLFLLALAAGFVALLTPCVFPMIPMTVSFFMKDKKAKGKGMRDGLIFGFSIILIYTIIGTLVAKLFGESFANWIATHWVPNVSFFLIFLFFAASFFGAFELTLPASFVNKMDSKADKGGLIGTFFMAFTIVLVSFSCTGPIVGTILVQTVQGGVIEPIIGMFGFGLAFAIPFALFAIFPQWLNNLPKSGGWLNTVKVVLGFLELALALKFLSIADLTYHWRILDREVFLALWIVIFFLLGLYLLGKLKFAHDSDVPFVKVPRLLMAVGVFAFVVYLIPGLWGAPLKAISGYLPPMHTQDFNLEKSIRQSAGVPDGLCEKPSFEGSLHVPLDLPGYFDYDEAVACGKEQNKPVFLDFTGHGCPNCRKFESLVWSDPKVYKLLKENFIIASLYVDDKTLKLPVEDFYTSRFSGREITTLSRKNADIQACYFNQNSQPMYVVLDGDENLMSPARGSTFNGESFSPKEFSEYLEKALAEFNKVNPKK
jgi:thiol:disulfide interchange protein DsbD